MKLLNKINDNILLVLLSLFAFFIPLYPKFPFQVVNYTYIAIRLDDLFIALIAIVFVLKLITGSIKLNDLPFKKYFALFWGVVFIALLSGIYLTKTIDYPYVGLLHALRRVEYMFIFFVAVASIRTVKDFKVLMYSLLLSVFLINVYGIGQRFFSFPAVSTMNPEYAKGRILFLTPEARLSSTFAGHYDLSGFMVFIIPIIWGAYFYKKHFDINWKAKLGLIIAIALPVVTSLYSLAASSGYIGFGQMLYHVASVPVYQYMAATMVGLGALYMVLTKKIEKPLLILITVMCVFSLVLTASRTASIAYLISTIAFLGFFKKFRYIFFTIIVFASFSYFQTDLVLRWLKTVQIKQIILNERTGEEVVVQRIKSDELPAGTSFIKSKKKSKESTASARVKQDLINKATLSGKMKKNDTASEDEYQTVTAVAADISIATRFQASWPRAIRAFKRNPLVGTGPSSITEASDGDYFRWIGETGAAGLILFMALLFNIVVSLYKFAEKQSKETKMMVMGVVFGLFGLLINAILIDIFEASKVAYMLWFVLGLFIGLTRLPQSELKEL